MKKISKAIVKYRVVILVVSILLLIPSAIGMINTRVNYDILDYLPSGIDTVEGQDILQKDFGIGGFSMVMVQGMDTKGVSELKSKIEDVDHVSSVVWYDTLVDISVPMEVLPEEVYDAFNSGDTTLMAVFFDTSLSSDETISAIKEIKSISSKQCFVSGMSALVTDLKDLTEQEEPIYILIAVVLSAIVLAVFMDSYLLPILFLASIGMAILYNLGTNLLVGEISYITKALSAVLQLGVTMDYSIFLWHSYKEQKERFNGDKERAMSHAITNTFTSVFGSSITTVAGFLALCFMSFTLGLDLGIVMAKGVIFGVIACVTILPALILVFDKAIEKTTHRVLIPEMKKLSQFVTGKPYIFAIIFVIILIPAVIGYAKTDVYYDLSESLPKDMDFAVANTKLQDDFEMNSTHMILCDADMSNKDVKNMLAEINKVDGVKLSAGFASVVGASIPEEMVPDSITRILKSDDYQMIIISSEYKLASDEVNNQITEINDILKKYDSNGMLIGEAPCTKDLITITDKDFKVVNIISILAIFIIIMFVLKSISLPIILVAVIEFAIFINLGIPYYTGTTLPFIASVVISTIQLGATVDYAILMTTRYKKERGNGKDKRESIEIAHMTSVPSVIVSALSFFAATFGVGLYSDVDMISSLCNLMSRGAIISMFVVIFILPAMLMIFDKIICATSIGFKKRR